MRKYPKVWENIRHCEEILDSMWNVDKVWGSMRKHSKVWERVDKLC